MKHFFSLTLLGASLLSAGTVQAHEPGQFIFRAGVTALVPADDTGTVLLNGSALSINGGNSELEVDSATQLGVTVNYMLSRDFSVELLASTPFKHTAKGLGELAELEIAEVRQLPPTLSLVYHLPLDGAWQPYVGAGVNYTFFFKEELTGAANARFSGLGLNNGSINMDSSFGASIQTGFDYHLNRNLLLNASVRWIDINTEATINFDNGSSLHAGVGLDPFVYTLALGWVL